MRYKWFWGVLAAAVFAVLFSLPARADSASAVWPQTGQTIRQDGKMKIEASHTADGYFMAAVSSKTSKRIKLSITKGDTTLRYDLDGGGDYAIIPLQLGSGSYQITLYENTSGKKYATAGKITLNVQLAREDAAFLVPSQYVSYTLLTQAVAKADELCAGKSEKDAYKTVCDFMKSYFVYDYVKAITVTAGALPDIDGCYAKQMGICQDLSAVMVCMLRTQGIPARLMIGYVGKNYHAWTSSTVGGEEMFFDPTAALNAISGKEYSLERYY